jgi:hypothetical protein
VQWQTTMLVWLNHSCMFVPLICCYRLLPHVEKVARAMADPELREVATNALLILERVSKEGQEVAAHPGVFKADHVVRVQPVFWLRMVWSMLHASVCHESSGHWALCPPSEVHAASIAPQTP